MIPEIPEEAKDNDQADGNVDYIKWNEEGMGFIFGYHYPK